MYRSEKCADRGVWTKTEKTELDLHVFEDLLLTGSSVYSVCVWDICEICPDLHSHSLPTEEDEERMRFFTQTRLTQGLHNSILVWFTWLMLEPFQLFVTFNQDSVKTVRHDSANIAFVPKELFFMPPNNKCHRSETSKKVILECLSYFRRNFLRSCQLHLSNSFNKF